MNLKELLTKLFAVCLFEEYGSTEHITEYIDSDDLIEFTKNSDANELKELSKLFKKLKKSYENGGDCDKVREKLNRLASPHKYELIDEIISIMKANKKLLTFDGDGYSLKLNGKFKKCWANDKFKMIGLEDDDEEIWWIDEDDLSKEDLEYALKKIKESVG